MKRAIIILIFLCLVSCGQEVRQVYIQSDLLPSERFNEDVEAIAVLNFDASAVRERNVDNIALRDAITYDIIKGLYEQKVTVIQGEAVQAVQEKEVQQATKGDYKANTSTIERTVTYKYNPYQKVDAVLSGRILKYRITGKNSDFHYIEVIIKLIDNVDGTIYWVTKMQGNYKDIIYSITHTLSNKTYTEPELPIVPTSDKK